MPEIKLEKVSKLFFDQKRKIATAAIFEISLLVPEQSFVIIHGPSGSGKTTLLKVIAGLYSPDEGSIFFDKQIMNNVSPNKRRGAHLTQESFLYPNLTCFENIAYPLKVEGVPVDEIKTRVYELSAFLNLDILLSRKPRVLSGGQKQLVSLAKALIKKPDVLYLDEPFSNLDADNRYAALSLLKSYYDKNNVTVFLSTHHLADVAFLSTFIITLNNGSLINDSYE